MSHTFFLIALILKLLFCISVIFYIQITYQYFGKLTIEYDTPTEQKMLNSKLDSKLN